MAWRAVVDASAHPPLPLSGVWLPRRMVECRERTGCQKQTAGTLFGFGTSLNRQVPRLLFAGGADPRAEPPSVLTAGMRPRVYPRQGLHHAGDPVPEMRHDSRHPVPRLLYFRGAAEASVEPVREALPLERRL